MDHDRPDRPDRHRAKRRLLRTSALFALLSSFSVVVWLLTGGDGFWPGWVLLSSAVVIGFRALTLLPDDSGDA